MEVEIATVVKLVRRFPPNLDISVREKSAVGLSMSARHTPPADHAPKRMAGQHQNVAHLGVVTAVPGIGAVIVNYSTASRWGVTADERIRSIGTNGYMSP